MEKTASALIATVGGTPAPLIETIRYGKPDYVCFICSQESVEKISEIKQQLKEIDSSITFADKKIIVSDINDLKSCYADSQKAVKIIESWGIAAENVVVDYTGGTKNMSVAAALATVKKGYSFSYVGGVSRTKGGLGVVTDGSEKYLTFDNVYSIFAVEELNIAKDLFNRFQFISALRILQTISENEKVSKNLKQQTETFVLLCEGYAEWDKFAHQKAFEKLKVAHKKILEIRRLLDETLFDSVNNTLEENLIFLNRMQKESEGFRKSINLHVIDLLSNAERRAKENKFDDAVARLYRALEMKGQISLNQPPLNIADAGKVPFSIIPEPLKENLEKFQNKDGDLKLGLAQVFNLLAEYQIDVGLSYRQSEKQMKSILSGRNYSILAHGNLPLEQSQYESFKEKLIEFLNSPNIIEFPKFQN